jgi:hypothetical protein
VQASFQAQADDSSSSPYLHDADGWLYRLELVDCGKGSSGRCRKCARAHGHGPYWYRYRWDNGKMLKRYVGKELRLSTLRSPDEPETGG